MTTGSTVLRVLAFLVGCMLVACTPIDAPLAEGPAAVADGESDRAGPGGAVDTEPLSVVLFMTDDQRYDSLWVMRSVLERLAEPGVVFDRAYVNTPMCCPARASVAAGGFLARNTGVLTNNLPNGSADRFDETLSMAVRLQAAGYHTGLVGKYLNDSPVRHVPQGWSTWVKPVIETDWNNYEVAIGSTDPYSDGDASLSDADQYLADYITDQSLAFLDEVGEDPFFLWVSHFAPHYPSTPSEAHDGTYAGTVYRGGAFNEEDISDKPAHVQRMDVIADEIVARSDEDYSDSLETLLSVDESVEAILDHLEESGRIDDTVFIFTSDNGYLWGEHRIYHKGVPYEEAVRVPLVVLAPDAEPGTSSHLVSVTTDIGATVYDLAGVRGPTDGRSLRPILDGEEPTWRQRLLLEGYEGTTVPTYAGVVTPRYKYVEYVNGTSELYDLVADPYEQDSLHAAPELRPVRRNLATWLRENRGLTIATLGMGAVVGESVSVPLQTWGGTAPFEWRATTALPAGLELSADGTISGVPEEAGEYRLGVRVFGSGLRPYDGEGEDFTGTLRIVVPVGPGGSSASGPAPPSATGRSGGVDVYVPADAGVPVAVTLSANGDFEDGLRRMAMGPDPVLSFDGLAPGRTYHVRVEALGEATEHTVTVED